MNSYDEKQYESYSYSLTYPEHLQTVGQLFKINPRNYQNCRVLELGCAAGGNIIPFANNFPNAQVVGIDYSKAQVEHGQALIKQLGLRNIQLEYGSIADHPLEGQFDYIICHGVYSWVDEAIRERILQIHQDHLSDTGIGCISYNTFPAWNMVLTVRDMMKFHVRNLSSAEEKVSQARSLLQFLGQGLEKDKSPYAKFVKDELAIISAVSDTYIYHEYLEEENRPVYFYEFVNQCKKFGLSYLSDSHVSSMFPGNLKKNFSDKLSEIKDVVRMGQYMDFLRNQRFRTTLICKDTIIPDRNLKVEEINQFCIAYAGEIQTPTPMDKITSNEAITFKGRGLVLTLQKPLVKASMKILHDLYGKPIQFDDLVTQSMEMAKLDNKEEAQLCLTQELNIMRLYLGGLLQIHMDTGIYAQTIQTKPETTELIRLTANTRPMVPNLRHETHKLQDIERIVLQFLDGQKTIPEMNDMIEQKIQSGELKLSDKEGSPVSEQSEITEKVKLLTLSTLESLVKKAYLLN